MERGQKREGGTERKIGGRCRDRSGTPGAPGVKTSE